MPRASPIQSNFNAGELSPSLHGRTDFEKYKNGCTLIENFIPLVQGPAERRPGTHFAASVKNPAQKTWLVPFDFSQSQSYVIEMGELYCRLFFQRAQVLNLGAVYEFTSPYNSPDLTNPDGTFVPTFAQSNDVMFWAHPGYFPRVLERFGHTNWAFRAMGPPAGSTSFQLAHQLPFGTLNGNQGKTVYANVATGPVNLTAGAGFVFEAFMVGNLFLMEQSNGSTVPAWEPGKVVAAGGSRRVDARVYRTTAGGTTGSVRPTHTEGSRLDGDAGVTWTYVHAGWGVVLITGVVDAAHATGLVITELPSDVVGVANATYRYQVTAWNSKELYPNLVGFFRERLYFIRGTTIWFSAPGDFFNFAERDKNGETTADQAITVTLASDTADPVRWARETPQGLLLGTDGAEWLIAEAVPTDPFGPANIRAVPQSAYGSRPMAPVKVQHSVLFMQRGGRKLREAIWGIDTESVKSRDLTVLSNHITRGGITAMAFQQEPRSTLWCTRGDGALLSFTYNNEQDVYGWHRHPLGVGSGGDARAESVCVIPSPDGAQDDLYMIVQRTLNGAVVRHVEWLDEGFDDGDDIRDAWYLDCALKYSGIPATTISGLSHLRNETVQVLADGAVHAPVLVNGSGQIALSRAASKVIVGLPCPARLGTMRPEAGSADGTAQGKTKRISRMHFRFSNTVGCKAGPSLDQLDEITFREPSMPLTQPVPPFTGDKEMAWPGNYDKDGRVYVVQDQPLPMTLVAIMPQLTTQDA